MPQHGDYDQQQHKWFCRYWMTQEEWLDVHDYAPSTLQQQEEEEQRPEEKEEADDEE
ncbi:hypothetical protein [Candidatus Nitrososphaera gargensis]|uniref:hypothetical protein n=1 Tax=Candidatus Nitrososphaera gargensis TaxID=497727 RepID=UPI00164F7993|nr:hypothetical protein [Candidatus Nitrososphaera gargensis]